jgi:hypothetical protein
MLKNCLLAAALAVGMISAAQAATIEFATTMTAGQEVPPHPPSGSGVVSATLDTVSKQFTYKVEWSALTGDATMAHFHGPAKPGVNAGVQIPIDGSNPTSPQTGTATLTDAQIKDLMAGLWYTNVHTAANPGGEIRGQLMPTKAPAKPKKKGKTS